MPCDVVELRPIDGNELLLLDGVVDAAALPLPANHLRTLLILICAWLEQLSNASVVENFPCQTRYATRSGTTASASSTVPLVFVLQPSLPHLVSVLPPSLPQFHY